MGDPGNIIGAEREVFVDFSSGTGILTTGTLDFPAGPGPVGPDTTQLLLFDNSVSSLGTLSLIYDGIGSAGLGGLDFDTNWDKLDVLFDAVQGEGELTLVVKDTSLNSGTLSQTVNAAGVYSFPFADAAYSAVDFTNVDSIKFVLETTIAASDFSIAQITREVVPEPSSGVLFAAAMAPLMLLRRRRSR
jgi:hypothetical protein